MVNVSKILKIVILVCNASSVILDIFLGRNDSLNYCLSKDKWGREHSRRKNSRVNRILRLKRYNYAQVCFLVTRRI
jgi:hypothetical protein